MHVQTYQANSRMGEALKAVASANVLHSRAKNPIKGNNITPTLQNMKYPMPIHEWYFWDVNSVSKGNVEEFSKPVTKAVETNMKSQHNRPRCIRYKTPDRAVYAVYTMKCKDLNSCVLYQETFQKSDFNCENRGQFGL